jgi:hypothetical protein
VNARRIAAALAVLLATTGRDQLVRNGAVSARRAGRHDPVPVRLDPTAEWAA